MLLVTVNEQTMVPFVSTQLQNLDLALALAKRGNLPGAEALIGQNFERLFASGQFKEAAEAAAESPQACLRVNVCMSHANWVHWAACGSGQLPASCTVIPLTAAVRVAPAQCPSLHILGRLSAASHHVTLHNLKLTSLQGSLRTKETVDRFKAVPAQPGQTSPLLTYFGTLLTRGKLNAYESVELSMLVLQQNRKQLLDNWLREVRP